MLDNYVHPVPIVHTKTILGLKMLYRRFSRCKIFVDGCIYVYVNSACQFLVGGEIRRLGLIRKNRKKLPFENYQLYSTCALALSCSHDKLWYIRSGSPH